MNASGASPPHQGEARGAAQGRRASRLSPRPGDERFSWTGGPGCDEHRRVTLLRNVLVAFVALEHLGFLVLEMFLFKSPAGRRIFRTTPEFAAEAAPLAANQGLYNGFLAAGLLWGVYLGDAGFQMKVFFLICIVIAGLFGGLTVSRKILFVQALPAMVTLVVLIAWG